MRRKFLVLFLISFGQVFQTSLAYPIKILIAEDNRVEKMLLSRLFTQKFIDIDIVLADNGKEAYEKWEKDTFDVVLSDNSMPEMGGIEWVTMLRAHPKGPDQLLYFHTSEATSQEFLKKVTPLKPENIYQKGTGTPQLIESIKIKFPAHVNLRSTTPIPVRDVPTPISSTVFSDIEETPLLFVTPPIDSSRMFTPICEETSITVTDADQGDALQGAEKALEELTVKNAE
jgi:two-component system chemotaxis response regulator CheY